MVVQSINLVADLRNQNKNIGVLYIATGLVTGGDNNGGVFWWNPSSTAADDGVDVIQVTGTATGRWVRITDNNNSVPSSRTLTINGTTYDLSADRTWSVGTVTSVSALTIGTSGTDLSSTVATGTTTPVITLNVPTASATNRGALSSADWTTFNSKQNAITLTTTGSSGASTFISNILNVPTYTLSGLGGVPASRTLTINGTAFDLSADRSWSVGTVTGTGASGQVTYWSGASSELGSNNLFWDAVNNRLGIGLVNPQRALEVYSATPDSHLRLSGSAPSVSLGDSIIGGLYQAKFGLATANGQYASASVAGDFVILSQTGATIFMTSATEKMRITAAGRMLLGLTTEGTYLLDVNGTSRISGVVTLSNLTGTGSRIVVADANGVLSASSALSSYVTGSGTTNILPKWTSSSALGNSLLDDDGTSASVALALGGAFNIKYLSAIKLALTGGTTFGSIDVPIGLDFLIRPDSIEKLKLSSTGLLRLAQYGTGAVIGTPTYRLATDASGNIIEVTDGGGTVTSVGLSMPSAFAVTNSPVTGAGTLTVTGAGLATQYIRGDGQLATFPSTASGGSSVNYYLNGSVNASVAGYKQLDNNAIVGGGTDFTLVGNGLIAQFLTDAGNPNRIQIPGGAWNFEMYFQVSSAGGNQKFYIELHKYDGSTFTLIASSSAVPEEITGGTSIDLYLTSLAVPTTTLLTTDRLAIRVYIVDNAVGRTITLHTENTTLCEIITTFFGGVSSLNGLSANTQYFATGTSGSDFNISSLVDTHTFNLPTASATNRGALSSADWSTFNGKVGGTGVTGQVAYWNGTNSQTGSNNLFWDAANSRLGIGTNVPAYRLHNVGTSAFDNGASGDALTILNNGYISMASTRFRGITSAFQFQDNAYNIRSQIAVTGGLTYFANGGGNVSIGSTTDGGQRLQVYGDALISNSAASGTFFEVKRTSTTDRFFRVLSTGNIEASSISTGDPNFQFLTGANNTSTTGDRRFFWLQNNFSPTSGIATYRTLELTTVINQTGGANGITRGLYVNPTLTAAADWRSIEWSNNSGWGLYGAGTANNYLAGSLGIGATSLTGYNLRLEKNITGSVSSHAISQVGVVQSDVTNNAFGYYNLLNTQAASFNLTNYSHFYADRLTIGAGSSITNQYGFRVATGANGATNNYAFHSNLAAATGVWNLYMAGTADNYLAGKLVIGTTTVSTFALDVNGTARVSGAATFSSSVTAIKALIGDNGFGSQWAVFNHADSTGASNAFVGIDNSNGSQISNIKTNGTFEWRVSNSNVMNLKTSGNLLVGTTVDTGERLQVSGSVLATSFIKSGGTSSQYLMADGSVTTGSALTITNRQTASYTLALTDADKLVEMNVATANNLTVPLNSSVAFAIGTKIDLAQYGAGQTTVVATSGVTVRSAGGALKLALQYSGASLVKIATNEWYLFGDITV